MSASSSTSRVHVRQTSVHDELIPLGHNWFIHDPNLRSVRVRYEAIPRDHRKLSTAEASMEKIVQVLSQLNGCRAALVPCLHRADATSRGSANLDVVLHVTLLNVEVLDMVHLMESTVPVHLYIGDPLTTGTPFESYSPEKLVIPDHIVPGDPIFCSSTERVTVFAAYLHTPDDDALYGLTAGQAVVPQCGFLPHPRLLPRNEKQQRRIRSSQLALQYLGRTLSSPAVKVVERAIQVMEAARAMLAVTIHDADDDRRGSGSSRDPRHDARMRQHDAEYAVLRDSLARPHEYDVGHACAAEAIIRPCTNPDHNDTSRASRRGRYKATEHTHLLSWALVRMSSKATDNPVTMHAHPGTLHRGTAVTMHVRDPNLERPLGPYRDGVANGVPASIVIDGHVAREWAIFPAAGKGVRFAARGDAGALVVEAAGSKGERDGGATMAPLAMVYAVPERGPYALVTPLTTVMRRIRDVTGMQLRFQGSWWRDGYG
ncbi:hypothetical protein C8Q77DRAFT_1074712 [Trametes polyzona]|nr:hypothetical protein C8Q77DRAFT_1074712 [Trametes polyzona]